MRTRTICGTCSWMLLAACSGGGSPATTTTAGDDAGSPPVDVEEGGSSSSGSTQGGPGVVAGGGSIGVGGSDSGSRGGADASAEASAEGGALAHPALGVYRWGAGGDPNHGPAGIDLFEQWLGQPVLVATEFEANDTWDNAMAPGWQMPAWASWQGAKAGRVLMLQVPLLPGPWDGSGPTSGTNPGAVSLGDCANGAYDWAWTTFAKNMVGYGLGNVYLRPGHEFNGGWYTWRASGLTDQFIGCFQHFVDAVRAVPGTSFRIIWNPALGYLQFPAEQAYPGDSYVDLVGIDVYDQSWATDTYPCPSGTPMQTCWDNAWQALYAGDHGLAFWAQFAQSHGKPLAVPEWGTDIESDGHGGGDDPGFVQHMHDFLFDPANGVAIQAKFDVHAGDIDSQLSDNNPTDGSTNMPAAAAKFRSLTW